MAYGDGAVAGRQAVAAGLERMPGRQGRLRRALADQLGARDHRGRRVVRQDLGKLTQLSGARPEIANSVTVK